MTADSFEGMWRKVDRAKQHTDDLAALIDAFWKTEPYRIGTKGDPRNGLGAYIIEGDPRPLPPCIALVVGDAVHNLRAALDHFSYAAVPPQRRTTDTAFPVWRRNRQPSPNDWKALVHGKMKGAEPALVKALRQLQVYPGGNGEAFWAIDYLDITDKHRLVLTVAAAHTALILDAAAMMRAFFPDEPMGPFPSVRFGLRPSEWTRVENGTELMKVEDPGGFKYDGEPEFAFDVTFGEPKVLEREPVVPTLRRLIDEVDGLLKRLIPLA